LHDGRATIFAEIYNNKEYSLYGLQANKETNLNQRLNTRTHD
jgi:hypothetical protein